MPSLSPPLSLITDYGTSAGLCFYFQHHCLRRPWVRTYTVNTWRWLVHRKHCQDVSFSRKVVLLCCVNKERIEVDITLCPLIYVLVAIEAGWLAQGPYSMHATHISWARQPLMHAHACFHHLGPQVEAKGISSVARWPVATTCFCNILQPCPPLLLLRSSPHLSPARSRPDVVR